MPNSLSSAAFIPLLLLVLFCHGARLGAEELALVYNHRIMEEISVDDPQYAEVDIGEITPETGGDPVFGIQVATAGLVEQDGQYFALVKTEEGLLAKKLQLGVSNSETAEVVEGLLPGDEVLVTDLDRVWSKYWELKQLWDDPVRNPETAQEITMLYRRFFNYTAITLIIAIPLILWLRKRARRNNNKG